MAITAIITITSEALTELVALRDAEPEGDRLGLRLEIVSNPGEDFKYDLSFDVVTKAAAIWPAMTSVTATLAPRYGIWVSGTAAVDANNSPIRWP